DGDAGSGDARAEREPRRGPPVRRHREPDRGEHAEREEHRAGLARPGPETGDRLGLRRAVDGQGRNVSHHPFARPAVARPVPRSRKISLTRAGAAMKMTITAWTTVTRSMATWEYDCIRFPPACSAPKSTADATT